MLVIGLTGGIGSGKSTFAALLAERGAQVIDADLLGRDALRPGEPAWHSVVDTFGDEVLVEHTMDIDRKKLAGIVFNDREKLAALNAIVHPIIVGGIADRLEQLRHTDDVVILDAALIVELGLADFVDKVVVVTADVNNRRRRLAELRGMAHEDIMARIGAQASEEDLVAKADIVVRNNGDLAALNDEADRVWAELEKRD
jgi:dephospho-CoA kinase